MRVKSEFERVAVKLDPTVKQWFADKAATYAMPMAVYMQYILTQFYETQMNNEAVRNLSALNKDEDLKDTNKMLVELMQMISEQQKKEASE